MIKCPICTNMLNVTHTNGQRDSSIIECPNCGKYEISRSLEVVLENKKLPYTASCWIREQNELSDSLILISSDLDKILAIPEKRINQKYELFLKYICKYPQKQVMSNDTSMQTMFWCKDKDELNALILKAEEENHLVRSRTKNGVILGWRVTYNAREFVENLGYQTNSNKIFMAFHFTNEMKEQFETTIRKAVSDASHNKLEAVRVSSSTTDHDTKIDDELIGMLKSSKAVIADFTGNRTAVYYEAGYAMGLGIPVIWTCRETDVDNLSFDTRQYPHIIWKDEEDLYKQVVNRLKAKIL